jgi:hypothetical protein
MRKRLLLLAVAAAAACAAPPLREHVLTGTARPAAWPGEVKILMEGAPVEGKYEEVAIVSATGGGTNASLPAVIGALQDEARELGCNGVIRVRYDRGSLSNASATGVAVWMN